MWYTVDQLLLTSLLAAANALGVGMIVPQAVRLNRLRVIDGLSGSWVGVGLAMNLWWLSYAVQGRLWGLVPVSVGGAALYGVIACQYAAIGGRAAGRSLAVGALGLAMAPLPFLVLAGWTAAGLAIGFSYGLQFAPAAVAAVRSIDVSGISPSTWTMAWTEAVIWFVYGSSVGDPALVVGGGGGAVMATVILVRLVVGRRGPSRPTPSTNGRSRSPRWATAGC